MTPVWWLRILWLGYVATLFVATHTPVPEPVAGLVSLFDKVIHCVSYFILTVLTAVVFLKREHGFVFWGMIAIALTGYAALDEYLQGFVNRSPDIEDWFADSIGILLGIVATFFARNRLNSTAGPDNLTTMSHPSQMQ